MGRQKQGRTGICLFLYPQTTASIRHQTGRDSTSPGTRRRIVTPEKRLPFSFARQQETRRPAETAPSHTCRLRAAQRRDVSFYTGERRPRPELLLGFYRMAGPRREERPVCKPALHEHPSRRFCFVCRRRYSRLFGSRKRMVGNGGENANDDAVAGCMKKYTIFMVFQETENRITFVADN